MKRVELKQYTMKNKEIIEKILNGELRETYKTKDGVCSMELEANTEMNFEELKKLNPEDIVDFPNIELDLRVMLSGKKFFELIDVLMEIELKENK